KVRNVVEHFLLDDKLRTADDIDVVLQRQIREEIEVVRRELGKSPCRLAGAGCFHERQQLRGEQFGKEDKVGSIVGRSGVDKELALLGKPIEILERSQLILNDRQPNRLDRMMIAAFGSALIVEIEPL